jgi:radical SAM-linked protein
LEKRYVDPLHELGQLLMEMEKPARYTGGEYGSLARRSAILDTLIAFPDLYEIGMSNQAMRIIYNRTNRIKGVSCDRAFAPAPDFEKLLAEKNIPLYGLDTGIAFHDLDILMFTFGYELGITEVLAMLQAGKIPVRSEDRGEQCPIVIMGGPSVSNPVPYGRFIDAFWIGEAEAGFFELLTALCDMKKAGEGRAALLAKIAEHPNIWLRGKKKAFRAVDPYFGEGEGGAAVFPVPSIKTVQMHGAVEIMRGCPNGCRFCHAGYWYRPMRQKNAPAVFREAEAFIRQGGYREISLSSLSTGDYRHIDYLVNTFNERYQREHVSFQLPSLRVSSFSLPLLEKVSLVRKSGLTFAVETPEEAWQFSINKQVLRDDVVSILREAKKHGWSGAKFYFMIGLPVAKGALHLTEKPEEGPEQSEEAEIVNFIRYVAGKTGAHCNINVGVFVPKPHTPYQRTVQMEHEKAREKLFRIKDSLKKEGHKVSFQDPFISGLEGLLSRGGEFTGVLIEAAFRRGCRLDAWSEYMKREVWENLFTEYREEIKKMLEFDIAEELPWASINPGISPKYFNEEFKKSCNQELTLICTEKCTYNCGICGKQRGIVYNNIHDKVIYNESNTGISAPASNSSLRILFSFSKTGKAVFLSHLSLVEIFNMAFLRAGIPVSFTRGFNPLPKLEILAPLSLGITGLNEMALIETGVFFNGNGFAACMNKVLPEGLAIVHAENHEVPAGIKKHSLSSFLWGFSYQEEANAEAAEGAHIPSGIVPFNEEKKYRENRAALKGSVYGLIRSAVLARDPLGREEAGKPYFEVFRDLYRKEI